MSKTFLKDPRRFKNHCGDVVKSKAMHLHRLVMSAVAQADMRFSWPRFLRNLQRSFWVLLALWLLLAPVCWGLCGSCVPSKYCYKGSYGATATRLGKRKKRNKCRREKRRFRFVYVCTFRHRRNKRRSASGPPRRFRWRVASFYDGCSEKIFGELWYTMPVLPLPYFSFPS